MHNKMNNDKDFLGREPIGRLMLKLAVPSVIAQIVNLLYNIVDRIYIGYYDETGIALTGVGVCLPIIMAVSAFAALVGMGGAPRASIHMGEGNYDKAERTMGNCLSLLVIISIILTAVMFFFGKPMLLAFGASDATVGYALEYLNIYLIGTLFVQIALGMNMFISAQGATKVSMLSVLIGAVTNIILDPVFIFTFGMGVRGAALATILSQALSAVWIIRFLSGKKTALKLKKKNLLMKWNIIAPCIALGVSPFIMQITESLISVCFNTSLLKYGGDVAVGSMTILSTLMQFCMLPLSGLTQGAQPITSYNFGAMKFDRVKKSFSLLLKASLLYSTLLWLAVMIFPDFFVGLFNRGNEEFVAYAAWAMRIYFALLLLMGAQLACQQTLIAIGNAKTSVFLALLRKIILLIPLIYILPVFFESKDMAVFLAEPVADAIAVTTTVILFSVQFKKAILKKQNEITVPDKGEK